MTFPLTDQSCLATNSLHSSDKTKWASPLQLPIPLTHEGLAHFERRCAATLAAFLCASCASPGGFLYHRKVRRLSYDIKK